MAQPEHAAPKYRPDIDGMRAIAVLLVVLDHLQFRQFTGGYVGVDVFFVISGYLIGASMIKEFRSGRFSLVAFYERRIRRIFPALLAMLILTSALAYVYLMPVALVHYVHSLLAALFSYSNFFFWAQNGYFDTSSAAKPLLHTWSLAVEEQFYVFFPLLLFVTFRWFPKKLHAVLWGLLVLTFVLACWTVWTQPATAFFWSPLRAWELLAGALISQYSLNFLRNRVVRELTALGGLLLIVYSAVHFTAQTTFPGWTALLPCAGAVSIIAAGQVGSSWTGRALSIKPMTFIGLISYSLYLFHWPIIVFQNNSFLFSTHPAWERNTRLLILAVSFALATLSWRFIETPFRRGRLKPARRPLFLINGSVGLAIVCFGAWVIRAQGVPSRFPDDVLRVASFQQYPTAAAWRRGTCFLEITNTFKDYKPEACLEGIPNHKSYLLVGDSTAAQLYVALSNKFPDIEFLQAASANCKPYEDLTDVDAGDRANCHALWSYLHTSYLPAHRPDAVILAALWGDRAIASLGPEIESYQRLNIPVILIGPEIDFDMPLPFLLSLEMQRHESSGERAINATRHLKAYGEPLDRVMSEKASRDWQVRYISYYKDLCGQRARDLARTEWKTTNGCPLFTSANEPLLMDEHHLTNSASLLFATIIKEKEELP